VLLRLARPLAGLTRVSLRLEAGALCESPAASDFPASHIRRIYGSLALARGRQLDAAGDKTEAGCGTNRPLRSIGRSGPSLPGFPQRIILHIAQRIAAAD